MIPRVIIISRKACIVSVDKAGESGGSSEPLSLGFRGQSSKGHVAWLKIDLNATEIITTQGYKCTKN